MTAVVREAPEPAVAGPTRVARQRAVRLRGEVVRLVGSLWALVTAAFLMIHLVPGDPARATLGPTAPASLVDARRQALGLNRSLVSQYWHYVSGLFHGDMGTSILTGQSVSGTIGSELPATAELAVITFALTLVIALPLGVVLAVMTRGGRRPGLDMSFTSLSVVIITVPSFLLAELLVYAISIRWGVLPIAGRSGVSSYVLPVLSLGLGPAFFLTRIVRVEVLAVLDADFVRTARSKRLPGWRIMVRDVLPNALTATLTIGGLLLSGLVAGTVLVEQVFSWPGLGATMVSSIQGKDYPVVQAVVLVYGFGVLVINFLVDLALMALDPRPTNQKV